jgi:hypothetical protein
VSRRGWENRRTAGENKVEQEANRGKNADSTPEGSLWNFHALGQKRARDEMRP